MLSSEAKFIITMVGYGSIGLVLAFVPFSTEVVVLCRAMVGAATILLLITALKHRVDLAAIKSHLPVMIGSSLCLAFNWLCLFAAYRLTTVAVASVLNYLAPILLVVAAPFLFHERITAKKAVCVGVAFVGVALVSGVFGGLAEGTDPLGIVLAIAAAFCFAGIVTFNKHLVGVDPLDKTLVQLFLAGLWLIPFAIVVGPAPEVPVAVDPAIGLGALLFVGVVLTGLVYVWYFDAIATLPVQTVAVLGYLEPVVSVLTSALILGEPLTPAGLVGSILVIGAALAGETWARTPADDAADAEEATASKDLASGA